MRDEGNLNQNFQLPISPSISAELSLPPPLPGGELEWGAVAVSQSGAWWLARRADTWGPKHSTPMKSSWLVQNPSVRPISSSTSVVLLL